MGNPTESLTSDKGEIRVWDRFLGWLRRNGNRVGWKIVAQVLAVVLGLTGWVIAAKTAEPRIPLSAAAIFFDRFYREVSDPARIHTAWETMTTQTFKDYSSLPYPQFRKYWAKQLKPSIFDVSKDGSSTFAVSLQYHPKGQYKAKNHPKADMAAVLACDNRLARWTFADCGSESLRLEDIKKYDLRVLDGG